MERFPDIHGEDTHKAKNVEILKIKDEIEKVDAVFYKELKEKYDLLSKLELKQLEKLCEKLLGRTPLPEYFTDEKTGEDIKLPQLKEDYMHFIIEELRLHDIEKYILENNPYR